MITKIRTDKDYKVVMKTIEGLLDIATKKGGFHKLSKQEAEILEHLSKLAEAFEDNGLQLMPIKPKTIQEAIEFKRAEKKLTRAVIGKQQCTVFGN